MGGFWLDKSSKEFEEVQHYMELCSVNFGEIIRLEVWKIENNTLNFKFERKTSSMLKVVSFININSMIDDNNLENVCSDGFSLTGPNSGGMEITTGNLKFDVSSVTNQDLSFLYADVAVGKACLSLNDGDLHNTTIPEGYDSFYIPKQSSTKRNESFSIHEYHSLSNSHFKSAQLVLCLCFN
jgi:hypothetical protein